MGICKNNNVKKKVTHFCYELRATLLESSSVSTQTETEYEDIGYMRTALVYPYF